jgi:hypothetical protein
METIRLDACGTSTAVYSTWCHTVSGLLSRSVVHVPLTMAPLMCTVCTTMKVGEVGTYLPCALIQASIRRAVTSQSWMTASGPAPLARSLWCSRTVTARKRWKMSVAVEALVNDISIAQCLALQ